jgi:PIN domain nuclease of toxin-antitoxin system
VPGLILDTHVVIRWLYEPRKLSKQQVRSIRTAFSRQEAVALSAMSLLEIAMLSSEGKLDDQLENILRALESDPFFRILPLSYEIAADFASLLSLRDPGDRAIVATARVHGLKLVTSDERIIESNLVPVID